MASMDLKTYLASLDQNTREPFALKCDTTLGHMRNVSYGQKTCSPELAVCVERESAGAVTRRDLRPDDWHRIWPELVTEEHPAPADVKAA